jgi:hypothetical protein
VLALGGVGVAATLALAAEEWRGARVWLLTGFFVVQRIAFLDCSRRQSHARGLILGACLAPMLAALASTDLGLAGTVFGLGLALTTSAVLSLCTVLYDSARSRLPS